jgi:hypothetical protein
MTSKDMPCRFCTNARSYVPTEEELYSGNVLTDDNDSSSISIGKSCNYHRLMLTSGWGKPVRIESETYCKIDDGQSQWVTHSVYYPKFCPECGRELKEYQIEERGVSYRK